MATSRSLRIQVRISWAIIAGLALRHRRSVPSPCAPARLFLADLGHRGMPTCRRRCCSPSGSSAVWPASGVASPTDERRHADLRASRGRLRAEIARSARPPAAGRAPSPPSAPATASSRAGAPLGEVLAHPPVVQRLNGRLVRVTRSPRLVSRPAAVATSLLIASAWASVGDHVAVEGHRDVQPLDRRPGRAPSSRRSSTARSWWSCPDAALCAPLFAAPFVPA